MRLCDFLPRCFRQRCSTVSNLGLTKNRRSSAIPGRRSRLLSCAIGLAFLATPYAAAAVVCDTGLGGINPNIIEGITTDANTPDTCNFFNLFSPSLTSSQIIVNLLEANPTNPMRPVSDVIVFNTPALSLNTTVTVTSDSESGGFPSGGGTPCSPTSGSPCTVQEASVTGCFVQFQAPGSQTIITFSDCFRGATNFDSPSTTFTPKSFTRIVRGNQTGDSFRPLVGEMPNPFPDPVYSQTYDPVTNTTALTFASADGKPHSIGRPHFGYSLDTDQTSLDIVREFWTGPSPTDLLDLPAVGSDLATSGGNASKPQYLIVSYNVGGSNVWYEDPIPRGAVFRFSLVNNATMSFLLQDLGYRLSDTEVPLDMLNELDFPVEAATFFDGVPSTIGPGQTVLVVSTPEPSSLLLWLLSGTLLSWYRKRVR